MPALVLDVTIGEALRQAADAHGPRIALREAQSEAPENVRPDSGGREWTYRDLLHDAERTAAVLLTQFEPGERVAVQAGNCPEWLLLEFGTALAALTLVTINPAFGEEELSYVLRQSRAAGLIVQERHRSRDLLATGRSVAKELPGLRTVTPISEVGRAGGAGGSLPAVGPGDPAQIQYTSGTTGRPKGALLSHRGLFNVARFFADAIGARPGDVWVNPMPLFHTAGCGLATLGALATGGQHVLPSGFDAGQMLNLIQSEHATLTLTVPTMLIRLLDEQAASPRDLSSWRVTAAGGAPVPPELVRRAERELGIRVGIGFGQTECSPYITHTRPDDPDEQRSTSVGRPLPGTEVMIADPATGARLPAGRTGEVRARGYAVMLGYFDQPEATRAAIDTGGWLHTGDLGSLDEAGYLRIHGRLKDMIIRGGENIYPREVEDVLFTHPDVADAAVVGLPDPEWGEIVGAFVRPRADAHPSPEDLSRYCRDHLASFKVPRVWRLVDSYPQTASGKIQKFALRESYVNGDR